MSKKHTDYNKPSYINIGETVGNTIEKEVTEELPESEVTDTPEFNEPKFEEFNAYVTSNKGFLNIRKEPDGEVIGKIPKGSLIRVLEIDEDWARMESGWVKYSFITKEE